MHECDAGRAGTTLEDSLKKEVVGDLDQVTVSG
jgi:hypothetical protein